MSPALNFMSTSSVGLREETVNWNTTYSISQTCSGRSVSARRPWIEIIPVGKKAGRKKSVSARRPWIEMYQVMCWVLTIFVGLREETVNWNWNVTFLISPPPVGLREETVNWNEESYEKDGKLYRRSPQGDRELKYLIALFQFPSPSVGLCEETVNWNGQHSDGMIRK